MPEHRFRHGGATSAMGHELSIGRSRSDSALPQYVVGVCVNRHAKNQAPLRQQAPPHCHGADGMPGACALKTDCPGSRRKTPGSPGAPSPLWRSRGAAAHRCQARPFLGWRENRRARGIRRLPIQGRGPSYRSQPHRSPRSWPRIRRAAFSHPGEVKVERGLSGKSGGGQTRGDAARIVLRAGKRIRAGAAVIGNDEDKRGPCLPGLRRRELPVLGDNGARNVRRLRAIALFHRERAQRFGQPGEPHFWPREDLYERAGEWIAPSFTLILRFLAGSGSVEYQRLGAGRGGEDRGQAKKEKGFAHRDRRSRGEDIATPEKEGKVPAPYPWASVVGRRAAQAMTPERRAEIAKKAASTRWRRGRD